MESTTKLPREKPLKYRKYRLWLAFEHPLWLLPKFEKERYYTGSYQFFWLCFRITFRTWLEGENSTDDLPF